MEATAPGSTFPNAGVSGTDSNVNRAAAGAHSAVDAMAGKAGEAVRKAGPAIDRVTTMAHNAVDSAANAAGPAVNWLGDQADNLNDMQKKLVDDACKYISANPLKSVGIALATGFILSRLIR